MRREAVPGMLVAGLAAATAAPSLGNGFVYDDVPAIVENPLLHSLSQSAHIWVSSYWRAGMLYRPLTIQLFALEWRGGGGGAGAVPPPPRPPPLGAEGRAGRPRLRGGGDLRRAPGARRGHGQRGGAERATRGALRAARRRALP